MTIRKAFAFEHEPESVNGVFEVCLRRSFASLLQLVEIIFDLFFVQFGRKATEVQRHGCNMAAVVFKGGWTPAEDGNVALKTLK